MWRDLPYAIECVGSGGNGAWRGAGRGRLTALFVCGSGLRSRALPVMRCECGRQGGRRRSAQKAGACRTTTTVRRGVVGEGDAPTGPAHVSEHLPAIHHSHVPRGMGQGGGDAGGDTTGVAPTAGTHHLRGASPTERSAVAACVSCVHVCKGACFAGVVRVFLPMCPVGVQFAPRVPTQRREPAALPVVNDTDWGRGRGRGRGGEGRGAGGPAGRGRGGLPPPPAAPVQVRLPVCVFGFGFPCVLICGFPCVFGCGFPCVFVCGFPCVFGCGFPCVFVCGFPCVAC
jgi:hypothetical protein